MKYYRLIGILGFIFIIQSCEKKLFDKRTKYIGDYKFTINATCTPNLGDCDTSYIYDGNIDYSSDNDKVIIKFESNFSIEPLIDHDNNLIQNMDHYQNDSLGKFLNKEEVEFVIRTGGLGGGYFRNIYGKKK
ncbi:MAG: hypothetical protein B7C24_06615 [Bacteroidetes bacterium 4572_77]|nr:MAG: hypothetical protein B7C24_06615 [Bacteroidetes bacterium 4572_77]